MEKRITQRGAAVCNLLDNCAILAAPDCTIPKTHGHKDFLLLVLGSGGGRLRAGQHIRDAGENACRVPLSLARATGAKIPEFGEAEGRLTEGVARAGNDVKPVAT